MRWDDTIFEGVHSGWHWIVSCAYIDDLTSLVIDHHVGDRLRITTFDSGAIKPNSEEIAAGWRLCNEVMVSPPLFPGLQVPGSQNDEWHVFSDDLEREIVWDRYVKYGGFHLSDARQLAESFDPTWERDALDWLYPVQERFWDQLDRLSPISYIGRGDRDIVVTRRKSFAECVRQAALSAG